MSTLKLGAGGTAVRAGDPADPGVIILHPWWGLTPWVEHVCIDLAGQGFSVICPDLYDGRSAATAEEARALLERVDSQVAASRVNAAVDYLTHRSSGAIAALGFSMGAAYAMELTLHSQALRVVVSFYGGAELPSDFCKATHARAFQGHFCAEDEWEDLETASALFDELAAAGRFAELHLYEGVSHWFMESDRPSSYAPPAAKLAWERCVRFLRAELA